MFKKILLFSQRLKEFDEFQADTCSNTSFLLKYKFLGFLKVDVEIRQNFLAVFFSPYMFLHMQHQRNMQRCIFKPLPRKLLVLQHV